MSKEPEYKPINIKRTLVKMKAWAKEKDRRYREQRKTGQKAFGSLVKRMKIK